MGRAKENTDWKTASLVANLEPLIESISVELANRLERENEEKCPEGPSPTDATDFKVLLSNAGHHVEVIGAEISDCNGYYRRRAESQGPPKGWRKNDKGEWWQDYVSFPPRHVYLAGPWYENNIGSLILLVANDSDQSCLWCCLDTAGQIRYYHPVAPLSIIFEDAMPSLNSPPHSEGWIAVENPQTEASAQ